MSQNQTTTVEHALLQSNGGCMTCGDSNEVKTPRETFCSTCGNGGAA
ncbi:MAG: hypothetical protein KGD60_13810 [Candidatus Thorarchaeota archaeon]|nr:hypothetical protein [Candidatus Thorarchaeota archaeon]